MHDTAFHIGTLAMNIYADLSSASILEVGSNAINGSLRDNALPTTKYVGLDLEAGVGVDIVIEPGIMPVSDNSFDLAIASSVFEHDPAFWTTFLEMCRKTKAGGYIYINAPSNGNVHRYPQDNWRFYPDSGAALAKWAVSQGQHVSLVESFIADRADDIWNDFVAVFRKGQITKKMPKTFIYEHVSCFNVMTWKSSEIINPRDRPEDLILLERALERAQATEQSLVVAVSGRDEAARNAEELREELRQTRAERDKSAARSAGELEEETVRRCHAEANANQWKTLYDRQLAQLAEMREAFEQVGKEQNRLYADQSAKAQTALHGQLQEVNAKLAAAEAARHQAQSSVRAIEAEFGVRFKEIATLTEILRQEEHRSEAVLAQLDWLRAVTAALLSQPKWWGLLPGEWRRRREWARLRRQGLFDAGAYLERYPDVTAAGLTPLHHYVLHGIDEGRTR